MIDARAAGPVPTAVQRSYLCWIASTVAYLLTVALPAAVPSGPGDESVDPYDMGAVADVLVIGVAVVVAGAVVVVARNMRAGRQWARITLSVFGPLAALVNMPDALGILGLGFDDDGSGGVRQGLAMVLALVTVVFLVAALVLQWLPETAPHFAAPVPAAWWPAAAPPPGNVPPSPPVAPDMAPETDLRALLAHARQGVLATIKSDGRPQLSPVTPFYDRGAGTIQVSMTEGRAKTANLRRDPRAALEVESDDGWAWATAEGTAELVGPGTAPDSPEVDALVAYYRAAAGEHPDWDEYRATMVSDRRVLMTLRVDRVYGERIR